ncbi:MAG: hypothetical protein KAU31_06650 [Spirochaetaceae bacterium]|nr:hypothetical protein [Spirochaetaceae bacterium]
MRTIRVNVRRRIGRALAGSAVLISAVLLSGCLDIVQYISGSASEIDVYFRLTLQKSLFEMGNALGGAPQDLDLMFEGFELNEEEVVAELPPGVAADFQPVNTDLEIGFELRYTVARAVLDSLSDTEAAFVPRVSKYGIRIPFSEGNGSGESDEFADAFLGSTKYRLMISKRLVSRISEARVLAGPESVSVSVTDLPDVWLLEFPLSLWYGSDYRATLEILF